MWFYAFLVSLSLNIGLLVFMYKKRNEPKRVDIKHLNEVLATIDAFCIKIYNLYFSIKLNPSGLINEAYSENEYKTIREEFYKMVIRALGPRIIEDASFMLGGYDNVVRYIAAFFEDKLLATRAFNPFTEAIKNDPELAKKLSPLINTFRNQIQS